MTKTTWWLLSVLVAPCIACSTSEDVSPPRRATTVSAGVDTTCVIIEDGSVVCWGNIDQTFRNVSAPTTMEGVTDAVSLSVGSSGCAVEIGGAAKCWGPNHGGQLGNGSTQSSLVPVTVSLTGVRKLDTAGDFACALLDDGSVRCWGDATYARLGNGTTASSLVPVAVSGITQAKDLAVEGSYACVLVPGGSMQCWGSNVPGLVGFFAPTDTLVPSTTMDGLPDDATLHAGFSNVCAFTHGLATCRGEAEYGIVAHNGLAFTPEAIQFSVGKDFACVLHVGGTVSCWGWNIRGRLGNGTRVDSATPVDVVGITDAISISAGYDHACAVLKDGSVRCWGSNAGGALGDGTLEDSPVPVAVKGL